MKTAPKAKIVQAAAGASRLGVAAEWLGARAPASEAVVVGPNADALASLVRACAHRQGAAFGWHRVTLGRLAALLAAETLAEQGRVPAGPLALEALCARVVYGQAADGGLGRFAPVAGRPGLPGALARTFAEVRMAGLVAADLPADVGRLLDAYLAELDADHLADRARVFEIATQAAEAGAHPLLNKPILLLDVPVHARLERELVRKLALRAPELVATVPAGDVRTLQSLSRALGSGSDDAAAQSAGAESSLARVHDLLFGEEAAQPAELGDDVQIFSTPGESLECVEIARRVLHEAEAGVPFDRMAVLLRQPTLYRGHLEEAFRRAGVPAFFSHGSLRPDPSGRAFLALLACKAEGLSARAFAEYLSLSEVPDADEAGAPPEAPPAEDRWMPPDTELVSEVIASALTEPAPDADALSLVSDPDAVAVVGGDLRVPRRWERLLVDAAVIGGLDRWERRLDGLEEELQLDRAALEQDAPDDPGAARIDRNLAALKSLRAFALPLLRVLDALPAQASWGEWIDVLGALATRALRHPERVLQILGELAPMAAVTGVQLSEVQLVLAERLTELLHLSGAKTAGRVYVAPIELARGQSFDVVFVPGLAERLFPARLVQDPILPDTHRREIDGLPTRDQRASEEKLLLRLACGAAAQRLVLSYPRLDTQATRARVPSFYALEVLRAAEGRLPGFDDLARRAGQGPSARLGWPAPRDPMDAIDAAEHDLALLGEVFTRDPEETYGSGAYLLSVNAHLERALRFRWYRWSRSWTVADGLNKPSEAAREAMRAHALDARSYSPTALQNYASCPYKFFLYAVHKLSTREEAKAIDVMDPLQRGSLVHDVQFTVMERLREAELLPVTTLNLDAAREILESTLAELVETWKERLAPAIPRVWDDEIALIRADLREWLRRYAEEPQWVPARFELSFGLKGRRGRDPASVIEPVRLENGIQLRGSIDLVEEASGKRLRATDYKTGRVRFNQNGVVQGGTALQPVLYALTLEKLFPDHEVTGGRLYYCTTAGEFTEREVPLDDRARAAAQAVADTIGAAVATPFLPAAPEKDACRWCDYQPLCGPYEEARSGRKPRKQIQALVQLRTRP